MIIFKSHPKSEAIFGINDQKEPYFDTIFENNFMFVPRNMCFNPFCEETGRHFQLSSLILVPND